MLIVGIDWSKSKHDAVLMDPDGGVLKRLVVRHSREGLEALAHAIGRCEQDPGRVCLAIEQHNGALLAWLLAQGYVIYGINPKSAQRARERYRPAGGKDDRSDAYILADMLRQDRGYLRPLRPPNDTAAELQTLGQLRAQRVRERSAVQQRLRTLLDDWSPEISALCDNLSVVAWQRDFLKRFPLLDDLATADARTVNAFIRRHRMHPATADSIRRLRKLRGLPVPAGRETALRLDIAFLVDQVQALTEAIQALEHRLEGLVEQHPDAPILRSLPVKGLVTTAALLGGLTERPEAAPRHGELAARWGVAPITVASGRSCFVKYRRACNEYMRGALMYFAFNTAQRSDCWAQDYYRRKRAAGITHYGALRCLAQRWLKILCRMWNDRAPYDEELHRRRLAKAAAALTPS
jgi:transposase